MKDDQTMRAVPAALNIKRQTNRRHRHPCAQRPFRLAFGVWPAPIPQSFRLP